MRISSLNYLLKKVTVNTMSKDKEIRRRSVSWVCVGLAVSKPPERRESGRGSPG